MSLIYLIGYRGTGKSTVARQLALRLGWDWADSDVEAELREGQSIAEIFATSGEQRFRDLESEALAELSRRTQIVVALGGGAVLREANRELIAEGDAVVWLQARAETIAERLAEDPITSARRPNLTNWGGRQEIDELLQQRSPIYQQCATLVVDTEDRTPAEVAQVILGELAL